MMSSAPKNEFTCSTLLGNWQEDRIKLDEDEKVNYKMGCDLLKEHERKRKISLHPIQLSNCKDGLKYGDTIMLVNLQTKSPLSTDWFESTYINHKKCKITTTSPHYQKACARNTFVIAPISNDIKTGTKVKYAEPFLLTLNPHLQDDQSKNNWSLMTNILTQSSSAKNTRQQPVGFTEGNSITTHWTIQYGDPSVRIENEGKPIECNEPVIVHNVSTNQLLASDKKTIGTDFGNEYEVTCHTYSPKGCFQALKKENIGFGADSRGELMQNKWIIVDSNGITSN